MSKPFDRAVIPSLAPESLTPDQKADFIRRFNVCLDRAEVRWGGPIADFSRPAWGIIKCLRYAFLNGFVGPKNLKMYRLHMVGVRAGLTRKIKAAGMTEKDYAAYRIRKAAENRAARRQVVRRQQRGPQNDRPWLSL